MTDKTPSSKIAATSSSACLAATALLVLALLAVLAGCSSGGLLEEGPASQPGRPDEERPNVVLVLTDDMTVEEAAHMPALRSLLMEKGTTFENAFVTHSLCCPSRATTLRGQYTHNHRVLLNEAPRGGFGRFHSQGLEDSTIATWLRYDGYKTALVGKYLNDYPGDEAETYVPPGWDEWYGRVGDSSGYYGFRMNENGEVVSYDEDRDYFTDVLARRARDYVGREAGGERPFFMWVGVEAPHAPYVPAPRHATEFADARAPRTPAFDEADTSDKPSWVRDLPRISAGKAATLDSIYRNRLRTLLAVDEMIAGLVEELEAKGELDDTYIVFTSDNGYHLGEHRLGAGKRTPYEEAVRVPLVVRGPGVPEGGKEGRIALNTDLAPTIAGWAGVPAPAFVDGRSLGPLLGDGPPPERWRSAFLVEHWGGGGHGYAAEIPDYRAVRTEEHKYVEYADGERELYDLRADTHELDSLHEGADPALMADLLSRLESLRECSSTGCRRAEDGP